MVRNNYPNNGKMNGHSLNTNTGHHISEDGSLVERHKLAALAGLAFGTNRNLYDALGYVHELTFDDFKVQYDRHEIAKAVIDRPVNMTWQGGIELREGDDENQTQLEKKFKQLVKDHKLKTKFKRVDKLASLGSYAVLLLGLDDAKAIDDFAKPVGPGNRRLNYVKPFSQGSAAIDSTDENPGSERYGMPEIYSITITSLDRTKSQVIKVHHSRVIHITGELLENEVLGVSDLRGVFNRLQDIEKITGGSAEMFWLGARPGYQADVRQDYQLGPQDKADIKGQLQEYEHNLRRFLNTKGIDLKPLAQQISDPSKHFEVQVQAISAERRIPKRILMGSERGELSSTQDRTEWLEVIQNRREEYAEDQIVRVFIDRCIKYGILPEAGEDDYEVVWSDLFAPSEKDKAEVGKIRAEALKAYASQPGISEVITEEQFVQYFLGLDPVVADKILEDLKNRITEDSNTFSEEEEDLEQEIEEQEA